MNKPISTTLFALCGFALSANAAVQANLNDLVLGFRATGGQGQNLNVEVNLGSVALYTNPASSPVTITRLAVADLTGTYGANWNARTDLFWGVVGTSGRVGAGGPAGQPLATLWATKAQSTVGTQSIPFTPSSRNGQTNASAGIETLLMGAPGSLNGATATGSSAYTAGINATLAGSYASQDTMQPGVSFGFFNPSIDNSVASTGYAVSDLYELQPGAASATYLGSFGLKSDGTLVFATSASYFTQSGSAPAVTTQPTGQSASAGAAISLSVTASGSPTYQWQQNGTNVAGGTSATLAFTNLQPANAGVYSATLTNQSGTTVTRPAIVGVLGTTGTPVLGTGQTVGTDVVHPNGNHFDQVLVTGAAESITNVGGRVTRTSFIDMNDDIVQIEFSGAGTLSVVLAGASAPAAPVNYNQPTVTYTKGHAGIIIVGANETTNLSIFTVGRATAFDPTGAYNILLPISATNNPANNGSSLFQGHATTSYDGVADVAFVAISSTNGKFGGLRSANATYWADKGITGVFAPGVEFTGPVYVGDINAKSSATPYLTIGAADVEVRITGGDLTQDNGRGVQIDGFTQLHFKDGSTSGGVILAAQANKAQLVKNGVDVTSQVALPPGQ